MSRYTRFSLPLWSLLLLVILLFVGCSEVRKLTYPSDITYIDRSQVAGAMRQMADAVTHLESTIRSAPSPEAVDQKAVVADLSVLKGIASSLQTKKGYSTDPVLDKHMSAFLDDVDLALAAAQKTPPSYFLAGHIAGSCAGCHRFK